MLEKNHSKEIVKDLNELSQISREIDVKKENAEVREIVLSLKDTMAKNDIIALSAPQIGINRRIFCIKDSKGMHSFINPYVQKATEFTFSREKDVCIDDKEFILPRFGKIKLNYQTPLGDMKMIQVVGKSAFVFQQMMDHLNGALISDIGLEIDELWDKASEDERAEVLKAYKDSLDIVSKKLDEEISQDEELNKQKKAIEFTHELVAGNVTLEEMEITQEQKNKLAAKLEEISKQEENKE